MQALASSYLANLNGTGELNWTSAKAGWGYEAIILSSQGNQTLISIGEASTAPEPATLLMLGLCAGALPIARRFRRK
ncbi:MAG: PEP-CTERM sorting domain-containing protein [Thermoguttaceae bacterium]